MKGEYVPKFRIIRAMVPADAHLIADEMGICGADVAPAVARAVFKAMWAESDQGQISSSS